MTAPEVINDLADRIQVLEGRVADLRVALMRIVEATPEEEPNFVEGMRDGTGDLYPIGEIARAALDADA